MGFQLIKKTEDEATNHGENQTKISKFVSFIKSVKGKKILVMSLIGLVVIALLVSIYWRYFRSENSSAVKSITSLFTGQVASQPEKEATEASKLDGLEYPVSTSNRHPLAVMIENHPDARPQSGLDQASIIYEAIAEGGITRFMAIFGPNSPQKVGPVRSARTYYLDWALEYDAFYSHVGGNIDALDLIPQIGIKDLDQFRYGTQAYWREPQAGKATEHTMFTDSTKLYDIADKNKWNMKADFDSFVFKSDLSQNQRVTAQSVSIDFSTDTYKVQWNYDPQTNLYKRVLGGIAHKDAISGNQLTAKNVVVQEVERESVTTRIGENGWKMTTTGSGKAKVILDGKVVEASWRKSDQDSRTRFYDSSGKEIEFNAGVTWYEIVPPGTSITTQ